MNLPEIDQQKLEKDKEEITLRLNQYKKIRILKKPYIIAWDYDGETLYHLILITTQKNGKTQHWGPHIIHDNKITKLLEKITPEKIHDYKKYSYITTKQIIQKIPYTKQDILTYLI